MKKIQEQYIAVFDPSGAVIQSTIIPYARLDGDVKNFKFCVLNFVKQIEGLGSKIDMSLKSFSKDPVVAIGQKMGYWRDLEEFGYNVGVFEMQIVPNTKRELSVNDIERSIVDGITKDNPEIGKKYSELFKTLTKLEDRKKSEDYDGVSDDLDKVDELFNDISKSLNMDNDDDLTKELIKTIDTIKKTYKVDKDNKEETKVTKETCSLEEMFKQEADLNNIPESER